jgi:hypothetical protein
VAFIGIGQALRKIEAGIVLTSFTAEGIRFPSFFGVN